MEVHQLRYALAVADEGSFTAAAQALHVTQSGVSAQVALLERELDTRLFDRTPKGTRVAPSAVPVLDQVRRALAELDRVRTTADEINGLVSGTVAVGTVAGLSWPAFLDGIQSVHDDHPGLELSLREGRSFELQADVVAGRLDVALVSWPDQPLAGLSSWVALDERVVAVVGPRHPWTARAQVSAAELLHVPVICTSEGTGMRLAYSTLMRAEGLAAPVSWDVTLPTTARALAARGLGVAVVTSSSADAPSDLHQVRIASAHATSRLGLVWRADPPPSAAARATLATLRAHLEQPQ
ncbi:LysR family transcriptional regulator [Nocardioides kongjuensis]|uniref:DNA-binding transcriptional LysR family regulator n=1 Tax=Nocardioides kongjuensis TaxID=349522 RepID=A0A852R7U4_9ACTN|nr:LysR family transcriptional regulator [Nocardioides kongjuensis]NYD29007.1 DNA-binding transcriptional LysR family regulator [Nocardioides kongjuensis]